MKNNELKLIGNENGGGGQKSPRQVPKIEMRHLECKFSDEEKIALSIKQARAQQDLTQKKKSLAVVSKQYKAEIEDLEGQIGTISDKVANGSEFRSVDVSILYHTPADWQKTTTRLDTHECWIEKMTVDESNLFNQEQRRAEKEAELQNM